MRSFWIRNTLTTFSVLLIIYGFLNKQLELIIPMILLLLAKDTRLFDDKNYSNDKVDKAFLSINTLLVISMITIYFIKR